MSGAFLMSREIFSHEIWQDVAKFRIFFYIVGNAVWSEKGVTKGGIQVGRGQYLRSYRNIREDLVYVDKSTEKSYSLNTIKVKIDELVKEGSLLTEDTRLGTLFTVVNYQRYQGFEAYKADEKNEHQNSKRTPTEHLQNGNRTPTEQQQNNKNYVNQVKQDITTTSTAGRSSADPVDVIAERFGELRTIREGMPAYPKTADYQAIARIVARGMPVPQTIKLLEQCFAEYEQRNPQGAIKAFSYCEKYIGDHFDRLQAAEGARQSSQTPSSNIRPFKPKQDEYKYDYGF